MKKILILLIVLFNICILNINASLYYPDFSVIDFENGTAKLMEDYTETEIKDSYKKIKGRFAGWRTYSLNINENFHYEGKITFARENNLDKPLIFNYEVKETIEYERSVKVTGQVSIKVDATYKNFKGALGGQIEKIVGTKESYSKTETTKWVIDVAPHKKFVIRAVGEARISNGVSKYYFAGIMFKKGTWEIMDVISEYYQMYEEEL